MHICTVLGLIAQMVARKMANPGVVSLILARSHTFLEIDHEIFSTVILLQLIQEGMVSVTKRMYVHKVLVKCLDRLAQEIVWLG